MADESVLDGMSVLRHAYSDNTKSFGVTEGFLSKAVNNKIVVFLHCLKSCYVSWYFFENDVMLRHEILC